MAGHQVALEEGNNTIALAVIAADRNVETYTIVVRRAAAAPVVLPSQAQRHFQAESVGAVVGGGEFEFGGRRRRFMASFAGGRRIQHSMGS